MMILFRLNTIITLFLFASSINAQFAPPAEQLGSTAIFADSSIFVDWANNVVVERGFVNIAEPSLGLADYGIESNTFGKANNLVLSLGDGGKATFQFNNPIINGEGYDFAVFENSFLDNYLELCFVEVSSDGENFFRFESTSLTQDSLQIEGFGLIDATKINNLGGKYRVLYGTPFDLEELANIIELDINNIRFIRLIDVVGCIDPNFANFDASGRIINDPWATPFQSSGFDIDAVGIIHNTVTIKERTLQKDVSIYPNPSNGIFTIKSSQNIDCVNIFSLDGKLQYTKTLIENKSKTIATNNLSPGIYILKLTFSNQIITKQIIIY